MTVVLSGVDIEAKARLAEESLWKLVGGKQRFAEADVRLVRTDRSDPRANDDAFAYLHVTVKDADATRVGRAFSNKAVEMALANYPGFFITSPPGDAAPFGVYWPALVPSELVEHRVVMGGETIVVPPVLPPPGAHEATVPPVAVPVPPGGPTERVALGTICGARSGDKGGNANAGVRARDAAAYAWRRG